MLSEIYENATVIQWGIVIGASLVAAITDLHRRRIPNALTVPLLLLGLIKSICLAGPLGLLESAGACVLLALPFVLLFIFAGGGAGDAKLMGAIGAWVGFEQGVSVLLCVSMAGIVLALARALTKGRLKSVLTNVYVSVCTFLMFSVLSRGTSKYLMSQEGSVGARDMTIPYGLAIFAGVCVAGGMVLI